MGLVEAAKKITVGIIRTTGRAVLSAQFPNDFEYYACTLEVTNLDGDVVESLTFPVMPSAISENKVPINTQKKTAGGVVSLFDPSFAPFDISVSGNFGKKLRLMFQSGTALFSALGGVFKKKKNGKPAAFNIKIKTGYGTIKLLEEIYEYSNALDKDGNPYLIFFYNLALNSNHLVEFKNLTFSQDETNNMIWQYSFNLKAIAPAYSIKKGKKSSILSLMATSVLNKGLSSLVSKVKPIAKAREALKIV